MAAMAAVLGKGHIVVLGKEAHQRASVRIVGASSRYVSERALRRVMGAEPRRNQARDQKAFGHRGVTPASA
jgi:hypothetical protein